MAKFAGAALKILQTALYAIEFCCAAIILGIFSYFLAILADRNIGIPTWEKAVEGLSGAAVLYLIFAVVLTLCLGGIAVFAFLGIVLDILFCGAMVAIAVMTRNGAHSCTGNVKTPLGNGQSTSNALGGYGKNGFGTGSGQHVTYAGSLHYACRLQQVAFAVSIIAAVLFLLSALVQLFMGKHHQKEKRYGPSPDNNYTSGSGKKFWKRKQKGTTNGTNGTHDNYAKDAELGTVGAGAGAAGLAAGHHHDTRPSHDTNFTGSTAHSPNNGTLNTYSGNKYEAPAGHPPAGSGYHTAPVTNQTNPYGYDNTKTTGTNF